MLTEEQYVAQQRVLGRRVHFHDGVWWEEVYPLYCKPAWEFKALEKGSARPSRLRSLLGYSHRVPSFEQASRSLGLMVLEGNSLEAFELRKLPTKKRNEIRRGIERCRVDTINELDPQLERIREINVAQASRQQAHGGAETPVKRYTKQAEAWRAQIRREFALEGREWWGAWVDGTLVAYLRTFQVDGIRVIQQTKADPAYYKQYPMDALYFTVLSKAAADPTCEMVINGSPLHESLNHYKEQFLFRAVALPWYSSSAWLVEAAKQVLASATRLRSLIRRASLSTVSLGEAGGKPEKGAEQND